MLTQKNRTRHPWKLCTLSVLLLLLASGISVVIALRSKGFYPWGAYALLCFFLAGEEASWGEDGLLGISDRQGRLCFALALWNGNDPILKERLFGLNGHEGNHGEDVKECYYYLDSTPTHSFMN